MSTPKDLRFWLPPHPLPHGNHRVMRIFTTATTTTAGRRWKARVEMFLYKGKGWGGRGRVLIIPLQATTDLRGVGRGVGAI